MTAATAISPPARISSSTGRSWRDVPDILERSGRRRDALHPDIGQLHPQCHRRPFRRRRRRRDRGSAADRRADPAMVEPASRILLPAAQVQDRGHRRRARPRRDQGARHRPAHRPQCGRRQIGYRSPGRRRPRPHADDRQGGARIPAARRICSPISRRSCASTISKAGATTNTRRRSRSWSTRSAPRNSPDRVEAEFAQLDGPSVHADPAGARPHRRLFRAADLTRVLPEAPPRLRVARRRDPAFDALCATNLFPHRVPGYARCHRSR